MLKISINADSLAAAAAEIQAIGDRYATAPLRVSLTIGPLLEELQEENLASEGRRAGLTWPALSAATVADRARRGFGPTPKLKRSGKLAESRSRSGFAVKFTHPAAGILNSRFPFVGFSEKDADTIAARIAEVII